jgi:chlorobactene glucosyltransferase
LLVQHQIGLLVFLTVILVIALSNLRYLKPLSDKRQSRVFPRVSIMLPARNEELNIETCVRSLIAQEYHDFQVVVLDDESGDSTWQFMVDLASEDDRICIIKGKPLPEGWIGKNWACHQLSQVADGELLLFTDADTRHHPTSLHAAVSSMMDEDADLITAIPHEEVISWAERLTIPVIFFCMMCFVPLGLAYRLKSPILSATIGQFMMFRKTAYEKIGGHAAIKQNAVDDISLGRNIKSHGLRWHLYDGSDLIRCRMYKDFHQVYEGLSKNLFAVFNYRLIITLFIWIWLSIVFFSPLVVLGLWFAGVHIPLLSIILAATSVAIAALLWGITYWRFGFPLYLIFLYPASMMLIFAIVTSSIILTTTGRTTWKGRTLIRQEVHW